MGASNRRTESTEMMIEARRLREAASRYLGLAQEEGISDERRIECLDRADSYLRDARKLDAARADLADGA